MSLTFPNPANATRICSSNKQFGIRSNKCDCTHPQISSIPSPTVKYQKYSRPRTQKMALKVKALALVVAIGMLPGLASRASASNSIEQVPNLGTQAEQARIDNSDGIVADSPSQLPLTLMIETIVASLLLVGLLTAFFANRSMRPIKTAAEDKKSIEPDDFSSQLATLGSSALETADITEQQSAAAEQANLLTEISLRIRQAQYLEDLLKIAVKELRRALKAERVFFYRFTPEWSGFVVAESVLPGWPSCLKIKVTDSYFSESNIGVEEYLNGRICVNDDVYTADMNECHLKLLEQFAIKAQMVAPVLKNNQLLGLLIVNQCSETRIWQPHEVDFFAQFAKQMGFAIEQVTFLEKQEAEVEKSALLTEITWRIQQAQFLEDLLKTTVKEVRRALKTDRVLIYGLDSTSWDGIVVAESVAPGWPQTLRVRLNDPCLRNQYAEKFKNGHITVSNDIFQDSRLEDGYRQMLEQFAVKANLVAPIMKNNQLLGLLIAHHCSEPRQWQQDEIDLFAKLAIQVGFAVDQVSLLEQMEEQTGIEKIEQHILHHDLQ